MQIDIPQEFQLPALRTRWKEVFADADVYLDAFEKTAFCADRCRCVTVGDEVVAALYWFDCQFQRAPLRICMLLRLPRLTVDVDSVMS